MKKIIAIICVLVLGLLVLGGCVSKEEHESVKQELEQSKLKTAELQKSLDNEKVLSDIKSDYIDLFKNHMEFVAIRYALDFKYDTYSKDILQSDQDQLINLEQKSQTIVDKARKKLNDNPDLDVTGLPEELDSMEELGEFLNVVGMMVDDSGDKIAQLD